MPDAFKPVRYYLVTGATYPFSPTLWTSLRAAIGNATDMRKYLRARYESARHMPHAIVRKGGAPMPPNPRGALIIEERGEHDMPQGLKPRTYVDLLRDRAQTMLCPPRDYRKHLDAQIYRAKR
jgi:hypothetical protein